MKRTFSPWVGQNYGNAGNILGFKVLILGESHYGPPGEEHENVTIDVIEKYAKKRGTPFFTTLTKSVLNLDSSLELDDESRLNFWGNIAFCNYIQSFVGEDARIAPTKEQWEAGELPFKQTVKELEPDLIIVFGARLGEWVPTLDAKYSLCFVNHPASGYSYARWNPLIQDSLRKFVR